MPTIAVVITIISLAAVGSSGAWSWRNDSIVSESETVLVLVVVVAWDLAESPSFGDVLSSVTDK